MNKNDEIDQKLKRVQGIITVINHHLDDVEEILRSVMEIKNSSSTESDKLPKYAKWKSYCDVFDNISVEKDSPVNFANMVGRLLYAMSKNEVPKEEATGVVDKLIPHMTHKETIKYMKQRLELFYPKLFVDDSDLFGDDLGMS